MDGYLLALQTARETSLSFLTPIMYIISEFAYYAVPLISIVLYLCVDKKKYTPLAFSIIISNLLMNFVKLIICIPRPWVSNPELHVADCAEHSATGYSCPSGHTTSGGVFYGSLALNESRGKKRIGLIILFVVMILLTGFSRNWLGAHTIIDVAGGIVVAFVSIFLSEKLLKYIDKHPERDLMVAISGCIICILAMIFYAVKSYPSNYSAAEVVALQKDGWLSCGFMIAWLISWYLDRHVFHISTDVKKSWKIARGIIVSIVFGSLYSVVMKKLGAVIPCQQLGFFLRGFVPIICSATIFPAIFVKWEEKRK